MTRIIVAVVATAVAAALGWCWLEATKPIQWSNLTERPMP